MKNLSFATTHDLEMHFATAGKVRSVVFPGADEGYNRGASFNHSQRMPQSISLTEFHGRTLVIESSRWPGRSLVKSKRKPWFVIRVCGAQTTCATCLELWPSEERQGPKRYDGRARGSARVTTSQDAARRRRARGALRAAPQDRLGREGGAPCLSSKARARSAPRRRRGGGGVDDGGRAATAAAGLLLDVPRRRRAQGEIKRGVSLAPLFTHQPQVWLKDEATNVASHLPSRQPNH